MVAPEWLHQTDLAAMNKQKEEIFTEKTNIHQTKHIIKPKTIKVTTWNLCLSLCNKKRPCQNNPKYKQIARN
jgi:hypothetical protein